MNKLREDVDTTTVDVVDQYKRYVQNSVMNRGFDFTTWHEQQFGSKPDGLTVESKVEFCVTDTNAAHK